MSPKIIFVTGTDTGVGKTLLTALLLHHLRQSGVHALGMKPFCSGGLADVRLLQSLQPGELTDREMNPYYFAQPIAPLVAAKQSRRSIRLDEVVARINAVARRCERLLIEGSGGLLVPLGRGYTVGDLIGRLDCQVVIVARNRLGTINHTLLTIKALGAKRIPAKRQAVVLMSGPKPDISSRTNQAVLAGLLAPVRVLQLPYFGVRSSSLSSIRATCSRANRTLRKLACVAR